MEEKNKKVFSVILMMVGALFIVISGGIFVSQTWHYLPEAVKKLCIAGVTAGFFAGSYFAEKKSGLKRTPFLLYYLGVCFTGFTAMSLLAPWQAGFSAKLFLTFLLMSVPVALHFWRDRRLADLIFQILLADGMVLCFSEGNAMIFSLSLVTMLLAGFSCYFSKNFPEERAMILTAQVFCWIHMAAAFPIILLEEISRGGFLFSVLPTLMLTASLTAIYLSKPCGVYRVLQSMGIFFNSLTLAAYGIQKLPLPEKVNGTELIIFAAFLMNLALTVWLNRREMMGLNEIFAALVSFYQIFVYAFSASFYLWEDSSSTMFYQENDPFYPYALCLAAALVLRKVLKRPGESWAPVLRRSLCWLLLGLHVLLCWCHAEYVMDYGIAFGIAILCLLLSGILYTKRNLRDVLRSLAVIIALFALQAVPVFPTEICEEATGKVLVHFGTEYGCILTAIAIVLLGKIWYDRGKAVRWLRFTGVCLILATLVCSNLASPALPNVLFLGMGALVLLVLSTIFRWKEYALASAITLTLVAVYLTREVWMSIAWWVYLFAAGVGLVIYAIKREKAE